MSDTLTATPDTTTAPAAPALTFPYALALQGIGAVLPHASKDMVTPIIASVRVERDVFLATDRYAVGRFRHNVTIAEDVEPVTLPRTAAEWLLKQTARALNHDAKMLERDAQVIITATSITITYFGDVLAVHVFGALIGNYPPVGRLVDGWEPSEDAYGLLLNAYFLARFEKSCKALAPKDPPVIGVELGKTSQYSKTAPIRIRIGENFDGLLQPNLPTQR
jgi:hypothetical protein